MKRIAWLLAATLCSAMLLFAGENNNPKEMIGWVCNAKCVDQSSGQPTCNKNCSETVGEVVLIQDNGTITKIANQDMAKPMSGKKCKVKGTMDPDTGMIAVQNIVEYGGGG